MTFTHSTRQPSLDNPWFGGGDGIAGHTGSDYDERFGWGKGCAVVGAVLWVIGFFVYVWGNSRGRSDDPFERVGNAVSGLVWGGAIFAFGCFVMLCGVIFMAGAQRV